AGQPIGIRLPEHVVLKVTEADAVIKGQTAASSYKSARLENGLRLMVPPFVTAGGKVVVDTNQGAYVRRAASVTHPILRSALLHVMLQAARKAARSLKRDFGEVERLQVSLKGPANFVSAADRRAEEILYEELSKARPGYGFLGEEGGRREGSDKTNTWIVDPLDGTTNFLHGIPQFGISIALERDGVVVAGLIYNPAH